MISYKAMVKMPGDKDWGRNTLRFASYEEAEAYGIDLARRWTQVIWLIQESNDPVTEDHVLAEFKGGIGMVNQSVGRPADWYEPPTPGPECLWCDSAIDERTGYSYVDVASIVDVSGNHHSDLGLLEPPTIRCPRCSGSGFEPKPERED